MKRSVFYLFTGILLCGCASVPFEPVPLNSVAGLNAAEVRKSFRNNAAEHFSVLESVVIRYRGREMTALGYTEVNEASDMIAVAGVTPVGLKIFEVKSGQGDLKYSFSFPQIKKGMDQKKIAEAIAEDIRRIYLGRVPLPQAEVFKIKDKIFYHQPSGNGFMEFDFGGPGTRLIEKRFKEGKKIIWKVRYFDYLEKGGKDYPSKIYFENYGRKYKVTLRLKEILA